MSQKEVVEIALRVLVAWTDRRPPASADLALLQTAFPRLAHLAADDLACVVINRFSPTLLSDEHQCDENGKWVIGDVA
jgi:hypothetical protein